MQFIANETWHKRGILNAVGISWTLHRVRYSKLISRMYDVPKFPYKGWTCILLEYGFTSNSDLNLGLNNCNEYIPGSNTRIDVLYHQPEVINALRQILGLSEHMTIYTRRKTVITPDGLMAMPTKQLVVRYNPPGNQEG